MKIPVQLQKYAVSISLCSILCLIILILLIISNKGFDFSDEGLYAIMTNPRQSITFSPINYDIIFKILNEHFKYTFDIQGLRLLRIVFTFIGSVFFFLGVRQIYSKLKLEYITVLDQFLFVIIAGFISSYNLTIQTPGYNEFSLIGVQVFAGSFIVLMMKNKVNVYEHIFFALSVLAGFILLLLTKPTGIPFVIIFSFLLLLKSEKRNKIFWFLSVWLLIVIVVLFFPLADRVSIKNYYNIFRTFSKNSTSHSFHSLFINILKGIIPLLLFFIFGYLYAGYKNVFLKKRGHLFITISLLIVIVVLFVDFKRAFALYSTVRNFYSIYFFSRLNYCLSFLFVFFFAFMTKVKNIRYDKSFILIFLIPPVLFFAIYFGADGSLLITFPRAFQFLIISAYLLFPLKKPGKVILILSIGFLLKFIISFFVLKPYNQEAIVNQKIPFAYGKNHNSIIYLDSLQYKNQKLFHSIISAYNTPYIVGFDILEGYIYLADKVYPGSFLWGDEDLKNYFNIKFNFPESFVLVICRGQEDKLIPYLSKYDFRLYDSKEIVVYSNVVNKFNFYFCKKK